MNLTLGGQVGLFTNNNGALRKIRREHDEWMRTVQFGVPYYTLAAVFPHRNDMAWTRDIHLTYVFDGRMGQWPYNNQLRATNGALSWQTWSAHGPLSTEWKPTQEHYQLQDELAEAETLSSGAFQRLLLGAIDPGARATHERAMADVSRRYPESVKALAGAR
jgi:hypothetical protein